MRPACKVPVDFDSYDFDPAIFDEMFVAPGKPREHCRVVYEALRSAPREELETIQERVTRSFSHEGITFTVYGDEEAEERIIPIDCVPRLLTIAEWRELEAGLVQRIATLNLFLGDIYGECRIVRDGVIPIDVIFGCPQYRLEMRGVSVPNNTWVVVCGTDIVRTHEGFMVLEDNLRVPSGVSYMIANRKAVKAGMRRLYRTCRVQEVENYGSLLRRTLSELAPGGRPDPSLALLTPGNLQFRVL